MKRLFRTLLPALALTSLGAAPHAHFLWLHLQPDATPRVEVLFGDGVHQDTDPSLVRYVEGLELRTASGERVPLSAQAWGLSGDLPPGTDLISATRDMQTFQRPGTGATVKLDYDSKAALDLDAAGRELGMTTELVLAVDGDDLIARVLFRGAPAPGATVFVPQWDAHDPQEVTADAAGEVRFPRPPRGLLSLRARVVVDGTGTVDGVDYDGEHHYAMLTVSALAHDELALDGQLEARQRLDASLRGQARLPVDVRGLAGVIFVELRGERVRGEFQRTADAALSCTIPELDAEDARWIASEVGRTLAPLFAAAATEPLGGPDLRIEPRDGHPLGRLIRSGDGAEWRVHDSLLRRVARDADGRREIVDHLDFVEPIEGRPLPSDSVRRTVDAKTGALLETAGLHTDYKVVDGLVLPSKRLVTRTCAGGETAARIEFRNLEIDRATTER